MANEHLLEEEDQGVAILTLNRPAQLNALNRRMTDELYDAVRRLETSAAIGCIVITGAGTKAFSAGGDIHEQRETEATETEAELAARDRLAARGAYDLAACAKPTIGMINGLAYGGAAMLASSLDIRIGCEHASFRFLAAAYGRINSTWTLPHQIGWPKAKELLFSARVVEADEAQHIGLLNRVVPCAKLRSNAIELGAMIAKNNRDAVIGIKSLLTSDLGRSLEEQWAAERDYRAHVLSRLKAADSFGDFIARKGRPGS